MAIKFNQAQGSAIKNKIDQYVYKNGDNVLRMVGDLLPRYVYWIKAKMGKIFLWSVFLSIEQLKHLTIKKKII